MNWVTETPFRWLEPGYVKQILFATYNFPYPNYTMKYSFIAVGSNHTDANDPCVKAIKIGNYRRSTAYVPGDVLLHDSDLDSSNVRSVNLSNNIQYNVSKTYSVITILIIFEEW